MVYLKSVELGGFKSFDVGSKISIRFDRGLTVLTGPIGSGKSNLIDAVRFALGESNARNLRVSHFGELLYDTPDKKSTYAWVRLVIDNSDFSLPVNSVKIEIKRRLSAKGSTYYLDGKKVSRKRLQQFLETSGIGTGSFHIIPQGTVIRMAEVELRNLREMLEELTGIAVYDRRKKEAEENLKKADQKIQVAEAKIEEVRGRLVGLERERNELLRHRAVSREVTKLRAVQLSQEIESLEGEIAKVKRAYERVAGKNKELTKLEEDLRKEQDLIRKELNRSKLAEKKLRLVELEGRIDQKRRDVADLSGRAKHLRLELERILSVEKEKSETLAHLSQEVKRTRDELRKAKQERRELERELKRKSRQLRKLKSRTSLDVDAVAARFEDQIADISAKLAASDVKAKILASYVSDLKTRKETVKSTLRRLGEIVDGIFEIRKKESEGIEDVNRIIKEHIRKKTDLQRTRERIQALALRVRDAETRFDSQRELLERLATEDRVLRIVKDLRKDGIARGVLGELSKLIRFRVPYRKALLASCVGWHRAIVVEDASSGLDLLYRLHRIGTGSAKIIPLSSIKPHPLGTKPDLEGIEGVASSFVQCEKRLRPAVDFIWGDTLIASSEESAIETASRGFRSVSLNGNVYEPTGAIIGGRFREPFDPAKVLPSFPSIRKLQTTLTRLERFLLKRSKEIDKLMHRIESLKLEKEAKLGEKKIIEANLSNASRNLRKARLFLTSVNRKLRQFSRDLGRERSLSNRLKKKKDTIQRKITELRAGRDLESEVIALQGALSSKQEEVESLTHKLKVKLLPGVENMRTKVCELKKKSRITQRQLNDIEAALSRDEETIEVHRNERKRVEGDIREIERATKKLRSRLSTLEGKIERSFLERKEIEPKLTQLHTELALKSSKLRSLKDELVRLGFEEPPSTSTEEIDRTGTLIKHFEFELKQIGEVNQLAARQYKEQMGKYKMISERINQLEKDRCAILSFIERLEGEKRDVFINAFKKINAKFADFFARMTEGGRAHLKLQDEEDPFAGVIDMFVQFPGKSTMHVSGLSGGEKSVAVVSLILSLGELAKSPFYMLDEVDAHLDQFYLERLGAVLKEQSVSSQIIIVSRHSPVLSSADKVYGFFMKEGKSHVISMPDQVMV